MAFLANACLVSIFSSPDPPTAQVELVIELVSGEHFPTQPWRNGNHGPRRPDCGGGPELTIQSREFHSLPFYRS
ncbi:MAG: hypothetical protein KDD44_13320, partial [Bdellovibrionales bacterium]|nr:hypothetical protein [Bdellovibrionales bacterium]